MKNVKSFKLFESGLPNTFAKDIQNAITNLFLEERFQPHIDEINRWTGGLRKFYIGVASNSSKFGIQYEVSFKTSDPVDIKLVNPEIKNSWREIMEIILDRSKSTGQVKVTRFYWFGHTGEGKKNGHTLEIEDVTDELVDAIEVDTQISNTDSPISITFTVCE